VSAFVRFLSVRRDVLRSFCNDELLDASFAAANDDKAGVVVQRYEKETCEAFGGTFVRRLFCGHCFGKLATERVASVNSIGGKDRILINLGPIVDLTIPHRFLKAIKRRVVRYDQQEVCWNPRLTQSYPQPIELLDAVQRETKITGRCACGNVGYAFSAQRTEVQHCYCYMCRQHSGGVFMSWIPLQLENGFEWTGGNGATFEISSEKKQVTQLIATRPTALGHRFSCRNCGSNIGLQYDVEQETVVWVAAASVNEHDKSIDLLNQCFQRRAHIGCYYAPTWYDVPDDELSHCSDC
jgi:hypothetical protein